MNEFLKSNVQVSLHKATMVPRKLNGPSDICSKPSMLAIPEVRKFYVKFSP